MIAIILLKYISCKLLNKFLKGGGKMRLALTKGKGRDILSEYLCEITSELDELAGFHKEETILHHYIILDELSEREKCCP